MILATPLFQNFSGVMSGQSLGACMPNLKSVSLAILELLALNAQNIMGSRDPDHTPFSNKFLGLMSLLSLRACLLNLNSVFSVSLAVFELLARPKIYGVTDPDHAPVLKIVSGVISSGSFRLRPGRSTGLPTENCGLP